MADLEFIPVLPSAKKLGDPKKAIVLLRSFGLRVQSAMQHYPRQRAHIRYRRTGDYGRVWTLSGPRRQGGDIVVTIGNSMRYARFLGGYRTKDPRQARWAAGYGWSSIGEVGPRIWSAYKPLIRDALVGR